MSAAVQAMESARRAVVDLVDREDRRTGSKMVAYENVASMIGRSSSWVRKFISRDPDIGANMPVFLQIKAQYDHFCLRIEDDTETRRARTRQILEQLNAADPRRDREPDRPGSRVADDE